MESDMKVNQFSSSFPPPKKMPNCSFPLKKEASCLEQNKMNYLHKQCYMQHIEEN